MVSRNCRPSRQRRRGLAVVEFAIILPVFVLLVLGVIEACSMIFLRQSLEIAAYEGVRVTLVPKTDTNNVIGSVTNILDNRNVVSPTITISPSNFQAQPYGTFITVTVSAPCGPNSMFGSWFYGGKTIVGEAQMMRER